MAKPIRAPQRKQLLPEQFSIPAELVEHILLGPAEDRRVLQDSPLLGDVWAAYALDAGRVRDVLITPHKDATAAQLANRIPFGRKLREQERARETNPKPADRKQESAKIAYLQGLVAAQLYFDEVLRILVPMTQWWFQPNVKDRIEKVDPNKLGRLLRLKMSNPGMPPEPKDWEIFTSLERYIVLAGLIYWMSKLERPAADPRDPSEKILLLKPTKAEDAFDGYQPYVDQIIDGMFRLYRVVGDATRREAKAKRLGKDDEGPEGLIFQVSLNRVATAALERSVPAVKADAAHSLFKVSCKNIVWAVLDCGIDGTHDALMAEKTPAQADSAGTKRAKANRHKRSEYISRVRKTFDFTKIREIVSDDDGDIDKKELAELAVAAGLSLKEASDHLKKIAQDAKDCRPINWETVEKLITLKYPKPPTSPHGTHVAGIIGASKSCNGNEGFCADGMCPDIRLYDFRVLGKNLADTEFAVIAALQYIRYVNERHSYITIHGANLSLSIPHSVRNYACGRTPVCNECERLVESGVVVVAAAGNRGFQKFETKDGPFENYAAFSITDPGNADSVITVGSTHSIWPHTYGVSFFFQPRPYRRWPAQA